ncbi:mannose-6-phosphate isomerase, class I [Microbacterium sp. CIAB417]|uniref:mannose-6-phosphate isomerase, class I n=1 Tax=Microbacterium sp. CIAB417 TaxID=2860287 RepID=UPI001FAE4C9B|nr:mannose-6-phosphate isomerase, class I [Microbacterium sp. CIAB417]
MLLSLSNAPRDYAWGSTTLLADLEGRPASAAPEAEVWFGDHASDPAELDDGRTLDAVTGGSLPYLLKLLAAADPLSIQVHPTIAQARDGRRREASLAADDPHRNYRDDNHKPELIVALSERFEALGGLRPVDATLRLVEALGDGRGPAELRAHLTGADGLRGAIAWLLSGRAQDAVDDVIGALETASSAEFEDTIHAIRTVAERNPGDPGVVVALLMNHIVLRRGEGIFLRAGLLHAYLSGLGVEIMAASDNVLRGGLTPKHIDVPELLSVLDATPGNVPVLRPADGAVTEYPVEVDDFALRRVTLDGAPVAVDVTPPAMVLATAGSVTVAGADAVAHAVAVGSALFSADEAVLTLAGTGEAFIAQPG